MNSFFERDTCRREFPRRAFARLDDIEPDRAVFLGLLARVMSADIAGAALAPRGQEKAGAALAVGIAVPLAYATLAGRKRAMKAIGQTVSGLIEDAMVMAAGAAIVALVARAGR